MDLLKKLFGTRKQQPSLEQKQTADTQQQVQVERKNSNKIGSVDIILVANKGAVLKIASIGAASGLSLREAISTLMGEDGSRNDLIMSANRISLSPIRKAWCETTPMYMDKKGGGIFILFKKIDDDTCKKEELEFLGTIDAKCYTAGLCAAHGIDAANVVV